MMPSQPWDIAAVDGLAGNDEFFEVDAAAFDTFMASSSPGTNGPFGSSSITQGQSLGSSSIMQGQSLGSSSLTWVNPTGSLLGTNTTTPAYVQPLSQTNWSPAVADMANTQPMHSQYPMHTEIIPNHPTLTNHAHPLLGINIPTPTYVPRFDQANWSPAVADMGNTQPMHSQYSVYPEVFANHPTLTNDAHPLLGMNIAAPVHVQRVDQANSSPAVPDMANTRSLFGTNIAAPVQVQQVDQDNSSPAVADMVNTQPRRSQYSVYREVIANHPTLTTSAAASQARKRRFPRKARETEDETIEQVRGNRERLVDQLFDALTDVSQANDNRGSTIMTHLTALDANGNPKIPAKLIVARVHWLLDLVEDGAAHGFRRVLNKDQERYPGAAQVDRRSGALCCAARVAELNVVLRFEKTMAGDVIHGDKAGVLRHIYDPKSSAEAKAACRENNNGKKERKELNKPSTKKVAHGGGGSNAAANATTTTIAPAPAAPPPAQLPSPPLTTVYPRYAALNPADKFASSAEAKAWLKNRLVREPPIAGQEQALARFTADPEHYVGRLYEALVDVSAAADKPGSIAYNRFAQQDSASSASPAANKRQKRKQTQTQAEPSYPPELVLAVCWKIWDRLLDGAVHGFRHPASLKFRRGKKHLVAEQPLEERFEAICKGLKERKTVAVDMMEGDSFGLTEFVFQPKAYTATKGTQQNENGVRDQKDREYKRKAVEQNGGVAKRRRTTKA